MPYIRQERRDELSFRGSTDSSELNYAITVLLVTHLGRLQRAGIPITYQHLNDCLGAMEGAKLEFVRRVVVPYEERKCRENGDVY